MPARAKKPKASMKADGGIVRLPTDPDRLRTKDQLRTQLLQAADFLAYMAAAKKGTPGASQKRNRMSDLETKGQKEGKQPAVAPKPLGTRQAYKAEIPVGRVRLPSLLPPSPPPFLPLLFTIYHATLAADCASRQPPFPCSENGRRQRLRPDS